MMGRVSCLRSCGWLRSFDSLVVVAWTCKIEVAGASCQGKATTSTFISLVLAYFATPQIPFPFEQALTVHEAHCFETSVTLLPENTRMCRPTDSLAAGRKHEQFKRPVLKAASMWLARTTSVLVVFVFIETYSTRSKTLVLSSWTVVRCLLSINQ